LSIKKETQKSLAHGAPMGFPDIAALPGQSGFDAPIECSGHQRFTALKDAGVQQQPAIGGKTGSFVS
jgi:hypothetical protein